MPPAISTPSRSTPAAADTPKLAPAAQVLVSTSYADFFPDIRSLFSGCLASSMAPAFAGGGLSAAQGRAKVGGGREKDSAVTAESAAATTLKTMLSFLSQAPYDLPPALLSGGEGASTSSVSGSGAASRSRAAAAAATAAALPADADDDDDDPDAVAGVTDDGDKATAEAAGLRAEPALGSGLSASGSVSALALSSSASSGRLPPPDPLTGAFLPAVPTSELRYLRIASSHKEVINIVRRALSTNPRWREVPPEYGNAPVWNLMWAWGKPPINRNYLMTVQKVNHFKHAKELTRKDLLKKNLARYQCLGPRMAAAFTLQPPTFVLPKEYLQFAEEFGKAANASLGNMAALLPAASLAAMLSSGNSAAGFGGGSGAGGTGGSSDAISKLLSAMGVSDADAAALSGAPSSSSSSTAGSPAAAGASNLWIMKPVGLSRGRGISLVSDISQVRYAENTIIQRYVANPLLLDGYKFDLRLYVLVTSFAPLEAFLYRRGFARLSSHKFNVDPSQIGNKFIHLTNSSVQRHSAAAKGAMASLAGADEEAVGGTKCSLEYLWKRLRDQGVDTEVVWTNIIDLVVKSLVCVDDVVPNQPNSFEVFGFDVLIDVNLKPWLIEVNASPSLGVDSQMDLSTKTQMLADTIALVDPLPFDRAALVAILERRMRNAEAFAALGPAGAHAASGFGPLLPLGPQHGGAGGGGAQGGAGAAPAGYSAATMAALARERAQLDRDLSAILHGRMPRLFGAMPEHTGQYQRICPGSDAFNRAMKLKFLHFRPARAGAAKAGAGVGGVRG